MALTMSDMLKRENVQIVDSCKDWEDSVHVAVQPLVDGGYVKPEYIDGIIQNAAARASRAGHDQEAACRHRRPQGRRVQEGRAVPRARHPGRRGL